MTKIGVTLPQFTDDPDRFMGGVEDAVRLGFSSLWVFDHLWPLGGKRERPILECWTALAYVAGLTNGVEIGTLVTRASLRNPVLLAKMASTVGAVAPGRVTVGLGSGDDLNRAENEAFGAPFYSGAARIEQLVSTLEIAQRYLKTPHAELSDDFVDVSIPASPVTVPPPKVWIGGRSHEALEVAGRIADGWNGWGANMEAFADDARRVASIAGSRPFEVSWAGQVALGATDSDAREGLGDKDPSHFLVGSAASVRASLTSAIEGGATHLIVALPDAGRPGAYERLAEALEPLT